MRSYKTYFMFRINNTDTSSIPYQAKIVVFVYYFHIFDLFICLNNKLYGEGENCALVAMKVYLTRMKRRRELHQIHFSCIYKCNCNKIV